MTDSGEQPTSKPKDDGWDVRVRETVNAPRNLVWQYLVGSGVQIWLGQGTVALEKGSAYATTDGVVGTVLGYREGSRVQLTWRPDDWPHDTRLELAARDGADGTTIVIHHEQLADRDERRMMLGHWKNVMAQLVAGAATQQLR
jgi:uncharacterized protein YndB with AHSA1/START domain